MARRVAYRAARNSNSLVPTGFSPPLESEKLGINVSEAVASKYMIRNRKPPSQGWRTFLENHAKDIIATDFFTVPTAEWTARQVIEAVGFDETPKYLIRDQDRKFSASFSRRVASAGLTEVLTAPASPWQNAYAERVVGTIRSRRHCGGLHHEYYRQAA